MLYRGYELRARIPTNAKVGEVWRDGKPIKLLKAAEGETFQTTAMSYVDFLIHQDEVDRQEQAQKENYEESYGGTDGD